MQNLFSPQVMGVLNVTPDSFSDGGRFMSGRDLNLDAVIDVASKMANAGAHWFDVGGESTRPGAEPVSLQEELDRVIPVVEALSSRFDTLVSVDTSTPEVILASAQARASMINDVRALRRPGALEAFASTDMSLCLMHMQGEPGSMQDKPSYESVVGEVYSFLKTRLDAVIAAGVDQARICLDPGFGFGKSVEHNLQLVKGIEKIKELGSAVLVGFSRKSMIGAITGREVEGRLAGTIALNILALSAGASILRVHDVEAAVDTISIWQAYDKLLK